MHKKVVSTCSPNNNMYWVCIQYIVKKFPDGLFLVTPYVQRIDIVPLVIQNAVYTSGIDIRRTVCNVLYHGRGGGAMLTRQKKKEQRNKKMWLFDLGFVKEITVFFDSFFAIFA